MKKYSKYLLIALILIVLGGVGLYLFRVYSPTTPKTTGTIPLSDTEARNLSNLIISLANMGDITTPLYKIHVNQGGRIQVTIFTPYAENKQKAINWFNDNGFGGISQEHIDFIEAK